ncbi:MAG: hypothetical protein ACREFY_09715 [Acetobacteraceae bacterium]
MPLSFTAMPAGAARSSAVLPLSSRCYALVWTGSLVGLLPGLRWIGDLAGLALVAFLLLEFPRQRNYARALLIGFSAAGLAGIVVAARGGTDPLGLFLAGWRRGAVYAAFYFALSALRDAAESSRLVRACGRHLVRQPPGRRYAALAAGGHVFGIILSYGAIDLLGAMVVRATADAPAAPVRARRMMMAVFRGLCAMNCWSPLNVMTAVVATAVPAAPMHLLLPAGFVVAMAMLALGWAEDRMRWRRRPEPGVGAHPADGWAIHLRLVALVGLVMALAEAAGALLGIGLVSAVTLVVPVVAFTWVAVQARGAARLGAPGRVVAALPGALPGALLARRTRRFVACAPAFRAEATVLGASGFMGVALGGALPGAGLAPLLGMVPPLMIPLAVPPLLMFAGQFGLNPIAMVALIGAAIPVPAALGVPPAVLAFACMLGWGLAVGVTPLSASAITTARWLRVSPWRVSTVWNAGYAAAALLLVWAAIAVLFLARDVFPASALFTGG